MAHRWVLLRGLAREAGHWGGFLDLFQNHFPHDEILTVDLPGAGQFRAQRCPLNMTDIYHHVREQADPVNQGPVRLLAVSLGAMVGMEWLRQSPEDLELCVFINSSARNSGPFYRRLRWQVWRDFVRVLTVQKPRERERALIEILMNNASARELALPLWTKLALERPVLPQNVLNQLLAAAQFAGLEDLPQREKMLLLVGLGDRLVDPSNTETLHRAWNCAIKHHPWAGHDLTWDDPQWAVSAIQEWLSHFETANF